jgi:hypothetical protein
VDILSYVALFGDADTKFYLFFWEMVTARQALSSNTLNGTQMVCLASSKA